MNRRFLNLVLQCAGGQYSVRHLDTSQLFYKSIQVAAKNGKQSAIRGFPELRRLPAAASFQFQAFRSSHYHLIKGAAVFGPFGKNKILCADGVGHTLVFDTMSHTAQAMPMMNAPKGPMGAIALSIPHTQLHATSAAACEYLGTDPSKEFYIFQRVKGNHSESVYIMDMAPNCPPSFEVLSFSSLGWLWRPLPPPPFLLDPMYEPRWDSAVAVKGNTIFVSPSIAKRIGTYSFDTVTQKWEKAGEWVLPFLGKAEFIPEFDLWFGFSPESPYNLCATSSLDSPEAKTVFADLKPPDDWSFTDLYMVNLGSGRLCTAKYYSAGECDDDTFEAGFVFSGVEVVHHDQARELRMIKSSDYQAGELLMIKHKSKCVTNLDIKCVL